MYVFTYKCSFFKIVLILRKERPRPDYSRYIHLNMAFGCVFSGEIDPRYRIDYPAPPNVQVKWRSWYLCGNTAFIGMYYTGWGNKKYPLQKLQYLWNGARVLHENFIGYWGRNLTQTAYILLVSLLHAEMVRVVVSKNIISKWTRRCVFVIGQNLICKY